MITREDNARLTQTGKGTPMGELLRRYWHPVAAVGEFENASTKQVRIMGEDLVLYKDLSDNYGLLAQHCPHRRADLVYGLVEECGLRCVYHGWAFDAQGNCIAQPYEDRVSGNTRARDQIKQPAYPVKELGGMLFAYLGPLPAPELPVWESYTWEDGFAQVVFQEVPCNWLQSQENSIDPVHFEWLHANWNARKAGKDGYTPTHERINFPEFEQGIGYQRILENETEADFQWAFPRMCILPNVFAPFATQIEYKVPIDDSNMLHVTWFWDLVPTEQRPYKQERIPFWTAPAKDPTTGAWLSSHILNQDTIAWVGQGQITDRENEHLARSDIGVVMLRRQLEQDMEAVAQGRDPKGVIRDPEATVLPWPFAPWRENTIRDFSKEEWLTRRAANPSTLHSKDDYFPYYAEQPAEVRDEYKAAMGLTS